MPESLASVCFVRLPVARWLIEILSGAFAFEQRCEPVACTGMSGATEIPELVLRTSYEVARRPLQLIDRATAAMLGPASSVRLTYRDLLADLDDVVAKVLSDESVEERARLLRRQTSTARQILASSRQTLDAQLAAQGVLRMDRYRRYRRRQAVGVNPPLS